MRALGSGALLLAVFASAGCGEREHVTNMQDAGARADASLTISPETGPLVCAPQAEIDCAIDVGERLPLEVTGTTAGRPDGYGGAGCGLGGDGIEDIAFRWTPPRDGAYRISTEGTAFDTILSLRNGSCEGREITCNDDEADGVEHSAVELDLIACHTITIVIDGRTVESVGGFRLTVGTYESACDDGTDDDGDGAADCDDSDCSSGASCVDWQLEWTAIEDQVLVEINARRAAGAVCGEMTMPPVPPLTSNPELRLAARLHSLDMTDHAYFSHDSLDGRMLADRVADAGFTGTGPLGENILRDGTSAAQAVAGWMSSPGHCENIMNAAYHVTGIGYADGADGTRFTQDFGGSG